MPTAAGLPLPLLLLLLLPPALFLLPLPLLLLPLLLLLLFLPLPPPAELLLGKLLPGLVMHRRSVQCAACGSGKRLRLMGWAQAGRFFLVPVVMHTVKQLSEVQNLPAY
jgi:hypothetical protein